MFGLDQQGVLGSAIGRGRGGQDQHQRQQQQPGELHGAGGRRITSATAQPSIANMNDNP